MAEITFGFATSHSAQLSVPPELWPVIAERDRANPQVPYESLVAGDAPKRMEGRLTLETWTEKYMRCQRAIDTIAQALRQAAPDVVIIMGDDQDELWREDARPALALCRGTVLFDRPVPEESVPLAYRPARWAVHGEVEEKYPTLSDLADHLIQSLMDHHFDVTQFTEQMAGRTLGHAFTFVRRRIMRERLVPMIPVMINTYYPPNQVRPARCWEIGSAIREAVTSWDSHSTVAIAASGGLSHFVVDEVLDDRVITGIQSGDRDRLVTIPLASLQAGSSEILNWIAAAAALADRRAELIDYIPTYRSPAGTGVGMAFMLWPGSS